MENPLILPEYQRLEPRAGSNARSSVNLAVIEECEAVGEVAALYDHFRNRFGRPQVPGILKCFATHPPLLRHMMALSESLLFAEGALGRRNKEMIATFVSSANECAYCTDSHGYFLSMHGGSREVICALQAADLVSPELTAAERVLLAFVQKVSFHSNEVTAADIESLRHNNWNDLQIAECIHITALFSTFNRVANAFGLPSQRLLEL